MCCCMVSFALLTILAISALRKACGTKQWDRQDQKSRVEGFLFHQNDFHFIVYIDIRKWKTNTTISVQK